MRVPEFAGGRLPVPLMAAGGVAAVMALLLYGQVQQLNGVKQQLAAAQQAQAQLNQQNQALGQQLADLESQRRGLEERVNSLRTQLSSATSGVERSRSELEDLQHRHEELKASHATLQVQLTAVTSERDEQRHRLQAMEQDKGELSRSLARLRERLTLLDRDYRQALEKVTQIESQRNAPPPPSIVSEHSRSLWTGSAAPTPATVSTSAVAPRSTNSTVELPPIIVRKDQAGVSVPVRGRLLDVNEAHRFAVVDKGSADGVRVGMVFNVIRGDTSVGRLTVVRVRPQLSACDIVGAATPGPLQTGDVAIQHGS